MRGTEKERFENSVDLRCRKLECETRTGEVRYSEEKEGRRRDESDSSSLRLDMFLQKRLGENAKRGELISDGPRNQEAAKRSRSRPSEESGL